MSDVPIHKLIGALQAGPPLRLAMMFGSAAKGSLREGSDVDVAILPENPNLSLSDELTLQTELARVCERDVDLVRLDHAPTFVRWQVARTGRVLVEGRPFAASRFVAGAVGEYLDFAPAFERAADRFRRFLATSGTESPS